MFQAPVRSRRLPRASRSSVSSLLLAATLVATAVLPAQQASEGLAASSRALAGSTSLVLATAAGSVTIGSVTFDGTSVALTPTGQPPQILLQLPSFVFGSFLLQTDAGHVLFGHSGHFTGGLHEIWLLPFVSPLPTAPLAVLPYNYDAAMLTPTQALVSARTGGFGAPDNELWVLDLLTGSMQKVASVPGASGPVALATNGDIYYATGYLGFPVPPASTQVVRFLRPQVNAAIATNTVLGLAHTQLVLAGLDAVGDMTFDDDEDLVFVDWFNSRVSEISDATGWNPTLIASLADYSTAAVFPTTVQFVPSNVPNNGGGVFEPFQSQNASLLIHETDYAVVSRVRTLTARPATLTATGGAPIAAGAFDLVLANGPSLGIGLMAFDFGATPGTVSLQVPGFEQPLAWSLALAGAPVLVPIAFDANGGTTLTVQNPGFSPAFLATVQTAFVSAVSVLGASNPVVLLIGQ